MEIGYRDYTADAGAVVLPCVHRMAGGQERSAMRSALGRWSATSGLTIKSIVRSRGGMGERSMVMETCHEHIYYVQSTIR
jgi:hypothetical protein